MRLKWIVSILILQSISSKITAQFFEFKSLEIRGNKRTKPAVFFREMEYRIGDTVPEIDSMCLVWQKRFSGLNLFNFVEVHAANDTVFVVVAERFYTWVRPTLQWADRNFNVWWQTRDPARLIYGGTLFVNNIGGLNHTAFATVISGYNQYFDAGYSIPFKSHKKSWGFACRGLYWTNHELWYKTDHDVLHFIRTDGKRIQKNAGFAVAARRRLSYFTRTEFTTGWGHTEIDSLAMFANPEYLYEGNRQDEYFARWEFIIDHRDQRDYPTKGYTLRWGYQYTQFNRLKSGYNLGEIWLRSSYFRPVIPKLGTVLAVAGAATYNNPTTYRLSRQLGYSTDYVRGYEPYVGDGNGFVLGKIGLRQPLVSQRTLDFKGPRMIKNYSKVPVSLWFNIFADAGKVIEPYDPVRNPLSATLYRGVGLGVDIIAWYSAMVRTEYSFNHLGEGIFNITFNNAF